MMRAIFGFLLRTGLTRLSRRRLPKINGRLRAPGLRAPAEVIRDRWGVPHIYALDERDLFFAQGFVHAQDRLWQMDIVRRLVAGRLAEVVGAEAAPADRWFRTIGMRRVIEHEANLIRDDVRAEVEAYVAGVNAGIAQGRLPVEFTLLRYKPEPWTAADSLSWVKLMSWSLAINWAAEILRAQLISQLGPEQAAELDSEYCKRWPYILPPNADYSTIGDGALKRAEKAQPFAGPSPHAGMGSNNWVLSGSRTASGAPILANDIHLLMGIPCLWYENHLSGGDLNITGITFPGVPGVISGHNGRVAWGFTTGIADGQDLYMERLRRTSDGRVQYEYNGQWMDARVLNEEIRVRGGGTVTEEVVITHHGPVINHLAADFIGEQPLALRWNSLEPDVMIEVMRDMNRARNCAELCEALRGWVAPAQNVVCADVEGNIAYRLAGKVPIRANGNGQVPVPGWTNRYEWVGYIPFEAMPHLYNPPQGYIATANNRVDEYEYPYYLGYEYCMGDRAQRITELIEEQHEIDVGYCQRMQLDQISPTARVVAGYLGQLEADDPELLSIVELMRDWDGELAVDSAAAAVYEVFIRRMVVLMLPHKLNGLTPIYAGEGIMPVVADGNLFGERIWVWLQNTLAEPQSHWFDLGAGQTRDDVIRLALRETVDFLKAELGSKISDWQWGKLHALTYTHILGRVWPLDELFNRGPYSLGGDNATLSASATSYYDLSCDSVIGAPFRFVADLHDLRNSWGLLSPGQSGRVGSPHYDDQTEAWLSGSYHPMLYERENVEQAAVGRLRLEPSVDLDTWLFKMTASGDKD